MKEGSRWNNWKTRSKSLDAKSSSQGECICPSDWVESNRNREARFQVRLPFKCTPCDLTWYVFWIPINAAWRFCMFSIGRELSGGMPPHEISDWGCCPGPTRQDSNFSLTSFGMQEMRWATEFELFSFFKLLFLHLPLVKQEHVLVLTKHVICALFVVVLHVGTDRWLLFSPSVKTVRFEEILSQNCCSSVCHRTFLSSGAVDGPWHQSWCLPSGLNKGVKGQSQQTTNRNL